MRQPMPERIRARLEPTNDCNKCWFCLKNNLSQQTTCICGAKITPTRKDNNKLVYRIFSFGCRSRDFPSCQRLHESLLNVAVQALEDSVLVAVRVGSDSQFAILIKDADGKVRFCASTPPRRIRGSEFLEISRNILESHDDRTAGKLF